MKFKIHTAFLLIVLLSPFFTSTFSKTSAHDPQSLNYGVDTLKISMNLTAGEPVEKEIRIYNLKNEEQTFEFIVNSFQISGENGTIQFEKIDQSTLQPSILIDPKEIIIPANSSKKVKLTFDVNEKAGLREYNYIIFVSPKTVQNQTGISRSLVEGKIGILTFINVLKDGKTLGEVTKRGGILEFSVPEINTSPPIKFTAKIGNSGNIHYDAVSSLEIYNAKNVLIETIKLKDITILPGTIRNLEPLDHTEIKWNYGIKFGKYKAVLNVNSLDEAVQLRKEIVFYVIPLIYLILILMLMIFLSITAIFIRKRVVKLKKVE